ncbi:Caspase-7 [Bulinus truncatus]|nr:Caspase-7 [Bulinus truncatus]
MIFGSRVKMEGGIQGLVIVFSACMVQVLAFGNYACVGIYNVYLLEEFDHDNVGVSLISSIHFALLLGCGPFISFLMTKVSYRTLSILGATLVFIGILGTHLIIHLPSMYLFFGVFAGLGGCFIYLPSHVLSGLYYEKYRSLSTGVATTGTGLGAIIMPVIVGNLIEEYTWKGDEGFVLEDDIKKEFVETDDDIDGFRKYIKNKIETVTYFIRSFNKDETCEISHNPISSSSQDFKETIQTNKVSEENSKSDVYDFTHHHRGFAVIINNEKFRDKTTEYQDRPGSSEDAKLLVKTFKHLGFHVLLLENLTALKVIETLHSVSRDYKHSVADCFLCVILSHGHQITKVFQDKNSALQEDVICGVDGKVVSTRKILDYFTDSNCPNLKGKPRMFFFQACRGIKVDDGVEIKICGKKKKWRLFMNPAQLHKDFLVMYGTPPGYYSWRRKTGTWFIQSLCSVLNKRNIQQTPLMQALVQVSGLVAQKYESSVPSDPNMDKKKEMPVIQSMLVKDIFFTKKEKANIGNTK